MKARRIAAVRTLARSRLKLTWDNGVEAVIDLEPELRRSKTLRPLAESRRFKRAVLGEWGHSVSWGEDLELGADSLWRDTLRAQGKHDAVLLQDWRLRHGLTQQQGADAVGISRRMLNYYESGERPVPRTVVLACRGWEAERLGRAA
ncbi:MAG: helix-turn-helix domain-containing protein [Panacagrimonas sp.]